MRSSVQTELKSSASARLVRSSSSLTVTFSRKFGRYRASFMRGSLLTVRQWIATGQREIERPSPEALDPPARVEGSKVSGSVMLYGSRTRGVKGQVAAGQGSSGPRRSAAPGARAQTG